MLNNPGGTCLDRSTTSPSLHFVPDPPLPRGTHLPLGTRLWVTLLRRHLVRDQILSLPSLLRFQRPRRPDQWTSQRTP